MNDKQAEILKATAAAQAAHERLNGTVAALQGRLSPRRFARRARYTLEGGHGGIGGAVQRHPGATMGALAVLGLMLARRVRKRHATVPAEARSSRDA